MREIRFGIVGCGVIADAHILALEEVEGAKTIGVFDANQERAVAFAARHNIKVYPSYAAMLADEKIDAVCLCTPSGLHADQTMQALDCGKHIVLEKPMALTVEDAQRVCFKAEQSHQMVTVISQHRFHKDVQYLKSLIDKEAFGKLVLCDLSMKYWRDPSYYAASSWRGTWQMDGGGALMNQGVHGVDLMRYLVGDVTVLGGQTKTMLHRIEVEDTAVALVEFSCGALGTIEASTAAYPGFSRRIEIHGSRGYAVLVDSALEKLSINGELLIDQTVQPDAGTASDPTQLGHGGHTLQLRNFVAALRGEEELLVTARDGLEAVRLIEKIYQLSEKKS